MKLDDLLHAVRGAHDDMLDLEDRDETEIEALRATYRQLAEQAKAAIERGEGEPDSDEQSE
ncbi:MAG: low affinity iron permease family protein [Pirellulales bacterium]